MKQYRLSEIAEIFGVNRATVYKWVKRHRAALGNTLGKNLKGQYITEKGMEILNRLVADRVTVQAAVDNTPATGLNQFIDEYRERIRQQAATIERLQQDIRDIVKNQQEERQRTDHIIFNLTNQVKNQALLIEDLRQKLQPKPVPVPEPAPVIPDLVETKEQPVKVAAMKKKPHPKKTWGIFKSVWVHLFQPELLRES